ncbi:hypothetical protein [Pseudomonas sp. EA_5y_Pfl2_R50]|uniref:hypothetical protein n=1 Tax=Pseudomonas sp. EA_5y_Pfl2_R50 TaxID=3088691 RepID=UPI0030DCB7E6
MRAAFKAAGYCVMTMFVSCGVGAQDVSARPPADRPAIEAAPERTALYLLEFSDSPHIERSR